MSGRCDRIEVYAGIFDLWAPIRATDGAYRWRYVAANGRILADSGQGYSRRIDALNGARRVTGVDLPRDPDRVRNDDGQVVSVWEIVR